MLRSTFACKLAILDKLVDAPLRIVNTNPIVYLDVTIDKDNVGRIAVELFADSVPKTAENFRSLCTGERGTFRHTWRPGSNPCPLHYKGIPFHRIIRNFIVQGGDILCRDGRGNNSVFGYTFFDESFEGKAGNHVAGTLAMAHDGPNRNGSQFFFNLKDNFYLNKRYVVFGQVLEGIEVLKKLNSIGTNCGVPLKKSWITECGQAGVNKLPMKDFDQADWYLHPPQHALANVSPSTGSEIFSDKETRQM
ncbi:cyclophilin [Perkinsela sp. CCAP 1560/4]|nr:cyclophilin [Perkinsela sp. CCAP 1560/4]|eukprot:KNH05264.1 cyclophilin [Perkinsela sp. CCAP 1560/4]